MSYDYDITAKHHKGDPLSTEAHTKTRGSRVRHMELVRRYIDSHPRGVTFVDVMRDLGLIRSTATARLGQSQLEQVAFTVALLHPHGMFAHIEAQRPVPGRRVLAGVYVGRGQVLDIYGHAGVRLACAAAVKSSRVRGNKAPIDHMSDNLWTMYRYVDNCGRSGSIADEAELRLRIDHSNCSTQLSALRTVKAVIPVSELHRYGYFRDIPARRNTRNRQGAAVLVTIDTVIGSEVSDRVLDQLVSVNEMNRLRRLLG